MLGQIMNVDIGTTIICFLHSDPIGSSEGKRSYVGLGDNHRLMINTLSLFRNACFISAKM